MDANRRKSNVALLSVVSNSVLVVLKIVVGTLIGSVSVISEAIHSGVDLLAAIIALVAVRTSGKPADAEHPFGHGKVENISGAIEAILIFVAAGWIAWEAIRKFLSPSEIEAPGWGVAVMAVSAVANWIVSRMLFKVGKETGSMALQADGWHLRTDVWTSAGVMAGLAVILLGDKFASHLGDRLHLIDPIAAMIVAALIVRAAWHLTVQTTHDLMDVQLPHDEEAWIRQIIIAHQPDVRGYHRLRTRRAGPARFIEFHMFVEGKMSVEESHRLAHDLASHAEEHFPGASVTIHVEPCRGDCRRQCSEGCFLTQQQRDAVRDRNAIKEQ